MSGLSPCASCSELVASGTCVCPHCGDKACSSRSHRGAAVLLGLTLVACGADKDSDSTTTTTTSGAQPLYGVTTTERAAPSDADLPDYVNAIGPLGPKLER